MGYDISFFAGEIKQLRDHELGELVRSTLEAASAWFWTAPASSTGKYHPPDSNGTGGLCRHTLKVVWFATAFARAFQRDADILRAAALLHDIFKFGTGEEMETGSNRPQYEQHAELAADFLEAMAADKSSETRYKWLHVCSCIRTHMGRWGKYPPVTIDQQLLHVADMAAAEQHFVAIEFQDTPNANPTDKTNSQENSQEKEYFTKQDDGTLIVSFGKYMGLPVPLLVAKYPSYVDWIVNKQKVQDFPEEVKDVLRQELAKQKDGDRQGIVPSLSEVHE